MQENINNSINRIIEILNKIKSVNKIEEVIDYTNTYSSQTPINNSYDDFPLISSDSLPSNLQLIKNELLNTARMYMKMVEVSLNQKLLIDNIDDILWRCDKTLVFEFISPACEKLIGYTSEEINGRNLFEFLTEESRNYLLRILTLKGEEDRKGITRNSMTYEVDFRCKNGSIISTEVKTTPILDENSQLLYFQGVTRNINDRKVAEKEKEYLLRELEKSTKRLEAEAVILSGLNKQLSESEKNLKDLNHTKDIILSIIGHDLKNPFQTIESYTDLLESDFDILSESERKSFIKNIALASRGANRLLENLLSWSLSQSGLLKFTPVKTEFNHFLNVALNPVQPFAKSKNINIQIECPDKFNIMIDQNMMETVLRNLISNAVKFSPKGSTISLRVNKNQKDAEITVTDKGIGISDEDISRILNDDINPRTIGTDKNKGTGLGLVLCKDFVKQHNGSFSLNSVLGEGSQFKVSLPLSQ